MIYTIFQNIVTIGDADYTYQNQGTVPCAYSFFTPKLKNPLTMIVSPQNISWLIQEKQLTILVAVRNNTIVIS